MDNVEEAARKLLENALNDELIALKKHVVNTLVDLSEKYAQDPVDITTYWSESFANEMKEANDFLTRARELMDILGTGDEDDGSADDIESE